VAWGFGPTYGHPSNRDNRVVTNVSGDNAQRGWSVWVYKNGNGTESQGRVFEQGNGNTRLFVAGTALSDFIRFDRTLFGGGAANYRFVGPQLNEWTHYWIYQNATGAGTHPAPDVYRNGIQVAVSVVATASGTWSNSVQQYNIGNGVATTSATNREWDGAVSDFAIYASALTTNEIMSLARGNPPYLVNPRALIVHLPLEGVSVSGGAAYGIQKQADASAIGAQRFYGGPPVTPLTLVFNRAALNVAAVSTSDLTVVSDEQGHTVAAPTQTQSHVLVNVAATQGHTTTAPFLIESIAGVPSTMGHTVAAPTLTPPLEIANASIGNVFRALRLTQTHSLSPQAADQISTASVAGLGGIPVSMGVANAETLPEVADYNIGDKPIGQWTVGTDYVAATANAAGYVALQQNLLNFRLANGFWGFTTTAPDFNQTASTVGVANAEQGETADPVDFTQDHTLVSVSAESGFTVAAPAITQPSAELGIVVPNTMGIEVAAPDLTILGQSLGVAASEVGYTVAAPNLFLIPNTPTPAIRIFIPAAEDRTMTVRTEDRSFAIAA
jgi:hypothetical protein